MERTVVVTGSGMATAPPDVATVRFAVGVEATDVSTALDRLGGLVTDVATALRAASLEDRDLRTSALAVYPSYDNDGRAVTGFRAQHQVSATVRRLDDLSAVISAAVAAGDNQVTIDSVSLGLADASAVESRAREAAVADARRKAAELAGHADASLGAVLAVVEAAAAGIQPRAYKLAAADAGGVPIETGEESVTVHVEVTFALG